MRLIKLYRHYNFDSDFQVAKQFIESSKNLKG